MSWTDDDIAPQQPTNPMRVTPQEQRSRDTDRLAILQQEAQQYPDDKDVQTSIRAELAKGLTAPKPEQAWTDDDVAQPAPTKTNSLGEEFQRQAGLTGRAALSAIGSVGAVPADFIGNAVNAVAGREVVPNQRRALQKALTSLGLPEPAANRPIENFTQGMAESAPAFALPGTLPAQVVGNAAVSYANAEQGNQNRDAAVGAAFGAGGQALGRIAGGLVKPTAEARTLMDRGVALTPGQAGGTNSFIGKAEQWAASNPVASHFVSGARRRAVEEANKAAAEAVVGIVDQGRKLGMPPREAIEQTRDIISENYHRSLDGMTWSALALKNDLGTAMQHLPADLPLTPPETIARINTYVKNRMGPLLSRGGDLTGVELKQIDAELGQMARNLANSPNATEKIQAPAWREVQSYIRNTMENAAATPEQHATLMRANAAYRQLLALEKAMLPGNETFTPRRLKMTLEKMGIKGTDLNRVADAMDKTLPNSVPNSGTAERILATGLPAMLLGGGGVAQGMGYDTLGTGMLAAGALGSRPGTRLMAGSMGGQQALANALRRSGPFATAAALRTDRKEDKR